MYCFVYIFHCLSFWRVVTKSLIHQAAQKKVGIERKSSKNDSRPGSRRESAGLILSALCVCVCARKKSMCLNWMEPKYAASDFSQEPLPKALFPPRITMCVCFCVCFCFLCFSSFYYI